MKAIGLAELVMMSFNFEGEVAKATATWRFLMVFHGAEGSS